MNSANQAMYTTKMKQPAYPQLSSEEIKRYELLCTELQRLAAFEAELDSDAIEQMKIEKLLLQQLLT